MYKFIVLLGLALVALGCAPSQTLDKRAPIDPHARLLWVDATANFAALSTPEAVSAMLDRAKEVGFSDIILDIKPLSGHVLYDSEHAPRLREWNGFARPDSFDFVGHTIAESRARGLGVHLAVNVMSIGHQYVQQGPVYDSLAHWQSQMIAPDNTIQPTTSVRAGYAAFVNPVREDVQAHAEALAREVVQRYRPDSYILDRGRYDNLYSDFSPESRAAFEAFLGRAVENWPSDILVRTANAAQPERGPLFREWLAFRASVIHGFFSRMKQAVYESDPNVRFATYVGAWYPSYYEVGVNWASPEYDPAQDYDWALPAYRNYGYAPMLDYLMTGNYYVEVTPEELAQRNEAIVLDNTSGGALRDTVYNVQSSVRDVERKIAGATTVFPSIYVEQYAMERKPENFERALREMVRMKGGVMVFDLIHLERDGLWDVVARVFAEHPVSSSYPYTTR